MASLIPGYEYDIFISYRQKDNKYDGWVTEFVDNLKKELEATFKEEVSVYFDINLSDGLLETHSVDKSLEGKLKCLVFVPVISQTYCDPKSFAWQHEFVAFNKIAREDPFGRDIRLASGNVASRILPVKIHDLDPEDKELLENELGCVLRAVEFIYREAGVNRPLKPNDDPKENLNRTNYRNQVNKVANAVKEIINAIKRQTLKPEEISKESFVGKPVNPAKLKLKIIVSSLLLLALIILGYFFIPKLFMPAGKTEMSIAVLPFKLLSNEPDKQYLADGMMDAILLHLEKFKGLKVISRTSVEQYKETTKTVLVIGQELDVDYLLEGSFQKVGDNVRLIIQLIKTRDDSHVFADKYDRNWKDIFSVQTEVAQKVAKELYAAITPEEKKLTEKIPTADMTAYDLYLKAKDYEDKYWYSRNVDYYQKSVTFYRAAIEIDTAFAKAYLGLAINYFNRYYEEDFFKQNFLDSCLVLLNIALSYDNQLDDAYFVKGRYYAENGQPEKALENFDKAIEINPNFYYAYSWRIGILLSKGDYVKTLDNMNKELTLIRGKERANVLWDLALNYCRIGILDKAKYYFEQTFELDKDKKNYQWDLIELEFVSENFEEVVKLTEKAMKTDSTFTGELWQFVCISGHNDQMFNIAKKYVKAHKDTPSETSFEFNFYAHWIGYAFWQAGKKKEAESYFNQKIKYWEGGIELHKKRDYGIYYGLAETYAFLGDRDKAYNYLDEMNKLNYCELGWLICLRHSQMFAGIRNEERFRKILQNEESKYKAEHERVRKWLEEQGNL
jgi:TolB-like protein/Tfp pilus assembly protein PilF